MIDQNAPPPSSIDLERSIIASFINNTPKLIECCLDLKPEMFYNSTLRKFYEYMVETKNTDMIILATRFKENIPEISECVAAASYSNLFGQIDTLKDLYFRRCLIEASQIMREMAHDMDTTPKETAEKTQKRISFPDKVSRRPELIGSIIPRALAELTSDVGTIGLDTGLKDIDSTLGLMYPGEFIIIAARPSAGKSSLALTMARHISMVRATPVMIFSLEMSKELTANRLLFGHTGADYYIASNRKYGHENQISAAKAGQVAMSEPKIFIDDTPAIKLQHIENIATHHHDQFGCKVFIVDHLQLMGVESRGRSRHEEMSEISAGLKNLARKLNSAVIAVSQLSRSVEYRNPPIPMLSDLKESGSLEQDAEKVVFLYRRWNYFKDNPADEHVCTMIVAKNRNGPTGIRDLSWDGKSMTFHDLVRREPNWND
jgi:replicative DNA helicase